MGDQLPRRFVPRIPDAHLGRGWDATRILLVFVEETSVAGKTPRVENACFASATQGAFKAGKFFAPLAAAKKRNWREKMASIEVPSGRIRRAELRAAAVRTERIAKPFGGSGKERQGHRARAGRVLAWALALRGLGHTYREIGALESALGRSMANAHWLRFLDAIETGQCACECPHCSLNVPERRNGIVRLLRNPKSALNRKAGTSNESGRVSGRASRKASGGRSGCDTGNDNGTGRYAFVELAGGLKVAVVQVGTRAASSSVIAIGLAH